MGFDFQKDPIESFLETLRELEKTGRPDPNAMSLATVSAQNTPSLRTVLFKGMVRGGLSFYTNYYSQKALELEVNPQASLLFFWPEVAQQIRIFGKVDRLTRAESETYFRSRPRLSQIGAWASRQSAEISGPEELQARVDSLEKKYLNAEIPCPEHWGGYRLVPEMIEFWFGREGRLHDRFVFERSLGGSGISDAKLSPSVSPWHRYMKSP